MGFSGGGSNVLLPHQHDGTVSQDGGPLNFNNITQSQSAAGEVFFSDGVHLQQLAYPGVPSGEILTAAAASTAPSWGAGGGAASMQFVTSSVLGVDANAMEFAISPAVQQADIAYLVIVLNSDVNAAGLGNHTYLQVNSLGSLYDFQGSFIQGGVQFMQNQTNQTEWRMHHVNHGGERGAICYLWCNTVTEHINGLMQSVSEDTLQLNSLWNDTAAQTEFNRIKIFMSDPAALMLAGTRVDVFKVVNT